jgi:HEAT repeat protein
MTQTLAELQAQLRSEDMGARMRVLNLARGLSDSERFTLAVEAVKDGNARIRYDAVSQLANLGQVDPAASLEILLDRLLRDSENDVKAAAADSIGALKLTTAFDDLLTAFRASDDWMLQFSIIAALGELGDPRGFDVLQECVNHPTDLVRIAAVGALGDLGDARALPVLLPLVNDEDWQIRHRVAQSLCRLGGEEAKAAITTLLDDPIGQVADAAKVFLTMIV